MIKWIEYDKNSKSIESHVLRFVTDGKSIYKADHAHRAYGYAWADDRGILSNITHWSEMNLPQAPETTEILNEAKADKGILTEEELLQLQTLEQMLEDDECNIANDERANLIWLMTDFKRSRTAEANYLSANAELSFKNMKYNLAIEEVKKHVASDGFIVSILNKALEELK